MSSGPAWNAPELQVSSDNPRRARYRLLQSWYREFELKVPPGRHHGGRLVGSALPEEEVTKDQSLNFLRDRSVAGYAQERVSSVKRDHASIEPKRLFHNLLSSQPLCFNIFGYLRHSPDASALLSQAFGLNIHEVVGIEVEWAPPPEQHLGDRTAFDATVIYKNDTGETCFLGVETKYTEPLSREVFRSPRYTEVTRSSGMFKPGADERLEAKESNQLWRMGLLAISLEQQGAFARCDVGIISTADDADARDAVERHASELTSSGRPAAFVSVEELTRSASKLGGLSEWGASIEKRYTDLSQIEATGS